LRAGKAAFGTGQGPARPRPWADFPAGPNQNGNQKGRSDGRCGLIHPELAGPRYWSSSPPTDEGLDELWSPECPQDGAGLEGAEGRANAAVDVDFSSGTVGE